jgi:hypothetical protein
METLQHAVVTLVALAAATFVARRAFVTVRPVRGAPRCASCPSASVRPIGASDPAPRLISVVSSKRGEAAPVRRGRGTHRGSSP